MTNRLMKGSTSAQTRRNAFIHNIIKYRQLFVLLLPGLIALAVFNYAPMYGITLAFKDYNMSAGILKSPWIGLVHFQKLFSHADFYRAMKNTLTISLLKLAFGFPTPIVLALLINEAKSVVFKRTVQTFTYLPHFFSWVVLGGIFTSLFSNSGPVNSILMTFGAKEPLAFFSNNGLFILLIIFSAVWQGAGWGSIVYLATLSGIDESLYEAACIDGAGKWKQAIYITLPCLVPTIITVFILNLGSVLNAGFDQIYNMYNPVVYSVSDIIDTYVLRLMQQCDYSFGTAVGIFKSVIGLVLVLGSNKIVRVISGNEQGLW